MSPGAARVGLVALSVLYYVLDLALLVYGCYLVLTHPSFWGVNLGLVSLVLAVALRPRFGRVRRGSQRLSLDRAPLLFSLVSRIADLLDARAPDQIVLTLGSRVAVQDLGVRGRTALHLGGIRWLSLAPQARVALVAHEVAHTVNGDPNRSRLVRPMLASIAALARSTHTERRLGDVVGRSRRRTTVAGQLGSVVLFVLSRPIRLAERGLRVVGRAARDEAEYRADAYCAEIAGTDAAIALVDRVLFAELIDRLLYNVAVHRPPHHWRTSVDVLVQGRQGTLELRREESAGARDPSDEHPPAGRRAQRLLGDPHREPQVVLTDAESAALDAQLSNWIEATHEDLLETREFLPRRGTALQPPDPSEHLG